MDLSSSGHTKTRHGFVGDVQQLQSLKNGGTDTQEGLKVVAQEFESLYLKMMLDSMRKAEQVWAKDNPFGSSEQDMFREMLDGQLSKELSSQGSLGLADMLVRQLAPHIHDPKGQAETPKTNAAMQGLQMPSRDISAPQPSQWNQQQLTPRQFTPSQLTSQAAALDQVNTFNVDDFAGKPDRFTEVVMPYAIKAGQELGVDPKLLVAQSALETGWGRSLQSSQHGFNMFGIKAGQSWSGEAQDHATHEVYNGQTLKQTASFRAYDSIEQSFNDYVALIKSQYPNAHAQSQNPDGYVEQLKAGGYATDPNYTNKVLAVYRSDRVQQASLVEHAVAPIQVAQREVNSLQSGFNQSTSHDDPRLHIW